MDDITSEIISSGVEGTATAICQKIWVGKEEVANGVDQITSDTPTKEGKSQTMLGLKDLN